jgi:hypothetical protein
MWWELNFNTPQLNGALLRRDAGLGVAMIRPRQRLTAVGTLKGYSKALEYEYKVKIDVLGTLKQNSIISLTLYLE